jgi:hypothetical protein
MADDAAPTTPLLGVQFKFVDVKLGAPFIGKGVVDDDEVVDDEAPDAAAADAKFEAI